MGSRGKIRCCEGCTERQVGCHGNCEKYIAEKAAHDTERDTVRKRKNEYYDVEHAMRDCAKKRATSSASNSVFKARRATGKEKNQE